MNLDQTPSEPLFSVVIPLFNKEKFIHQTLISVLEQTYSRLEVIVVDDGSTDGSMDVVGGFADPRITVIRQPNGGVSIARNTGLAHARGPFVAFLDGDDFWHPDFLRTAANDLQRQNDIQFWSAGYHFLLPAGRQLARHSIPSHFQGGFLSNYFDASLSDPIAMPSTSIVARRVANDVGGFEAGVSLGEDLLFWAKVSCRGIPLYFNPEPLATYRRELHNNISFNLTAETKRLDILPFLEAAFISGDKRGMSYYRVYARKSAYRQMSTGRPMRALGILGHSFKTAIRHGYYRACLSVWVELLGLVRVAIRGRRR